MKPSKLSPAVLLFSMLLSLSVAPAFAAQYESNSLECVSADQKISLRNNSLNVEGQDLRIVSDLPAEQLFSKALPMQASFSLLPKFIDISEVKTEHARKKIMQNFGSQGAIKVIYGLSRSSKVQNGACHGVVVSLWFHAEVSVSGSKDSAAPARSEHVFCYGRQEFLSGQCI